MDERYARFSRLLIDRPHPRVLRVVMNRPDKLNAADADVFKTAAQGVASRKTQSRSQALAQAPRVSRNEIVEVGRAVDWNKIKQRLRREIPIAS